MKQIIQGQKIVLRSFQAEDAVPMFAGVNNPISKRLTGTHATFEFEQVQRYLKLYDDGADSDRAGFAIALPETLRAVGEVVINEIDADNHSANIRIWLFHEDDFNKGYGGEAMRLMVDYGFRILKLHRISLGVYDFNDRAIRVYEKIGFHREGILRDSLFYDGVYHHTIMMSILAHEYASQSSISDSF